MNLLTFLFFLFCVIVILFRVTHQRPLNRQELVELATKRRATKINEYFSYDTAETFADYELKKQMDPNGAFYTVEETLSSFPSKVAALIRYETHEWIIIAFEQNQKIDVIWLNKGENGLRVSSRLPPESIAAIAKEEKYNSVLLFHNHPNINPEQYDFSKPSEEDLKSAKHLGATLNSIGVNLVEFICERGKLYRYFLSAADSFFPLSEFISEIDKVNGESKQTNLALHTERIFGFHESPQTVTSVRSTRG